MSEDFLGEPDDVKGECNAHAYIKDNYDDGHRTVRCHREKGHRGFHESSVNKENVAISWFRDERRWDLEEPETDDEE